MAGKILVGPGGRVSVKTAGAVVKSDNCECCSGLFNWFRFGHGHFNRNLVSSRPDTQLEDRVDLQNASFPLTLTYGTQAADPTEPRTNIGVPPEIPLSIQSEFLRVIIERDENGVYTFFVTFLRGGIPVNTNTHLSTEFSSNEWGYFDVGEDFVSGRIRTVLYYCIKLDETNDNSNSNLGIITAPNVRGIQDAPGVLHSVDTNIYPVPAAAEYANVNDNPITNQLVVHDNAFGVQGSSLTPSNNIGTYGINYMIGTTSLSNINTLLGFKLTCEWDLIFDPIRRSPADNVGNDQTRDTQTISGGVINQYFEPINDQDFGTIPSGANSSQFLGFTVNRWNDDDIVTGDPGLIGDSIVCRNPGTAEDGSTGGFVTGWSNSVGGQFSGDIPDTITIKAEFEITAVNESTTRYFANGAMMVQLVNPFFAEQFVILPEGQYLSMLQNWIGVNYSSQRVPFAALDGTPADPEDRFCGSVAMRWQYDVPT